MNPIANSQPLANSKVKALILMMFVATVTSCGASQPPTQQHSVKMQADDRELQLRGEELIISKEQLKIRAAELKVREGELKISEDTLKKEQDFNWWIKFMVIFIIIFAACAMAFRVYEFSQFEQ